MRQTFMRRVIAVAIFAPCSTAAFAESVKGTITANGKATKLAYVAALPDEEGGYDGRPVKVVLAERTPKAAFSLEALRDGAQGDFFIATIETGEVKKLHDEFVHKGSRASVNYGGGGFAQTENLKYEGGTLSGRIYTPEPYDFMGEVVEADVTFAVAAPE